MNAAGHDGFQVRPFFWARRLVVDAGRAARHRHPIHGLVEVDITAARRRLHAIRQATGTRLSFTAFLVCCIAEAVAAEPAVHAYHDLRGRLVIFDDVDIGIPIELRVPGGSFAFTHVIRRADKRTIADIHHEIRLVRANPHNSPSLRLADKARAYLMLPPPLRTALLGLLHRLPHRQRALAGTVGVTAVGMFGAGAGWGIGFPLHTLSVVIGGIAKRPLLHDGRLVEREFLQLTISADHDVVDGAPTARFIRRLRRLIESAHGLPDR